MLVTGVVFLLAVALLVIAGAAGALMVALLSGTLIRALVDGLAGLLTDFDYRLLNMLYPLLMVLGVLVLLWKLGHPGRSWGQALGDALRGGVRGQPHLTRAERRAQRIIDQYAARTGATERLPPLEQVMQRGYRWHPRYCGRRRRLE